MANKLMPWEYIVNGEILDGRYPGGKKKEYIPRKIYEGPIVSGKSELFCNNDLSDIMWNKVCLKAFQEKIREGKFEWKMDCSCGNHEHSPSIWFSKESLEKLKTLDVEQSEWWINGNIYTFKAIEEGFFREEWGRVEEANYDYMLEQDRLWNEEN